jgi:SAM-dependent methyltransferase
MTAEPNAPYFKLASLWFDFRATFAPDYGEYLRFPANDEGMNLRNVLDMACGTGNLTLQFADIADRVVGLDASEPMLAEARRRTLERSNIRFVAGDFRTFDLQCGFDAAVCGGDSLNYVADLEELRAVFRRVAVHLVPRGLFLFDVLNDRGIRACTYAYFHYKSARGRFVMCSEYDKASRISSDRLLFPDGVERHTRIPLDHADVRAALDEAGFDLVDHFPDVALGGREFYVARKSTDCASGR